MSSTSVTLDAQVIATWVGLIIAVVGGIVAAIRWLRHQLQEEIRDATRQIQPGANGGASLADANRAVDKLTSSLQRIHTRLDAMEQRSVEQSRDMDGLLSWASGRPCLWQIDRALRKAEHEADDRGESGAA